MAVRDVEFVIIGGGVAAAMAAEGVRPPAARARPWC